MVGVRVSRRDDDMFTSERHLLTPGQRRHSPQRHTAAGTAVPTTTDTGDTVPQRVVSHPSPSAPGVLSPTANFIYTAKLLAQLVDWLTRPGKSASC